MDSLLYTEQFLDNLIDLLPVVWRKRFWDSEILADNLWEAHLTEAFVYFLELLQFFQYINCFVVFKSILWINVDFACFGADGQTRDNDLNYRFEEIPRVQNGLHIL